MQEPDRRLQESESVVVRVELVHEGSVAVALVLLPWRWSWSATGRIRAFHSTVTTAGGDHDANGLSADCLLAFWQGIRRALVDVKRGPERRRNRNSMKDCRMQRPRGRRNQRHHHNK